MRLRFIILAAFLYCAPGAPAQDAETLRRAFYAIDSSIPLNPDVREMPERTEKLAALRTRYHLAYDSAHDQRVTAILSIPKQAKAPYPAVLLLAGSGGHKDTDYIRIVADMFATLGCATISIDAQYHGERAKLGRTGDFHFINTSTNRDAWVQTVVDLRRAVDYLLTRPEVDPKRIGYLGFSQGGMVGGTLLGVETRISVACLAVPAGGLVELSKKLNLFKPEFAADVEMNASIVDPIYFIGRFSPRPLLVLAAKKDELIPKIGTDALFEAAKEPKLIIWYESGHVLNPILATKDIRDFFSKQFGLSAQ